MSIRGKDRPPSVVAPRVLAAAKSMSRTLSEKGIAHALIGGLAVNAHGYPRTTSDVDFLLSEDAQSVLMGDSLGGEALGKTVLVGKGRSAIHVDFLFPKSNERFLEAALRVAQGGVIPKETLVYMKLACGRMKDTADVVELLKRGKLDTKTCINYLKRHRPDLVEDFESLVTQAQYETD